MSGEQGYEDAKTKLEKFLVLVDGYIESSHANFTGYDEQYAVWSSMTPNDLSLKSKDELFDGAYTLYSYANYLQDEVNKNQIITDWCSSELDKLLVSYEKTAGFDKYVKHDMKRARMIVENSFATKLDQMNQHATSRLQALDGKVYNLKRQADILLEKAKRK